MEPELEGQVKSLYEDAKVSLWTVMTDDLVKSIPEPIEITTNSKDRKDYVYHPDSGEVLRQDAIQRLKALRNSWNDNVPDIQFVISDVLNPRALMDDGH